MVLGAWAPGTVGGYHGYLIIPTGLRGTVL